MKAEIEGFTGIFLIHEHIASVIDTKSAEDDAQLLDNFECRPSLPGPVFRRRWSGK